MDVFFVINKVIIFSFSLIYFLIKFKMIIVLKMEKKYLI